MATAAAAALRATAPAAVAAARGTAHRNERTRDQLRDGDVRRTGNAREGNDARRDQRAEGSGADVAAHDDIHSLLEQPQRQILMADVARLLLFGRDDLVVRNRVKLEPGATSEMREDLPIRERYGDIGIHEEYSIA